MPAIIEFIYKNMRHAEYRLQAREYNKKLHAILNSDISIRKKIRLEWIGRRQVVWYSQGVVFKDLIIPKETNTGKAT